MEYFPDPPPSPHPANTEGKTGERLSKAPVTLRKAIEDADRPIETVFTPASPTLFLFKPCV